MPEPPSNLDFNAESYDLEQWIREAGDYILPSRDLRPRVVEAAKQSFWERKQTRRAGVMAMAACVIWVSLSPINMVTNRLRTAFNGPSLQEFHDHALRLASQPHECPDWGLAQAILASRQLKKAVP